MASQTGIKLVLSGPLFNALRLAAQDNGRSIEAEVVAILARQFSIRDEAMTDSTTALAAVGVVLGIDGSGAAPRGF